MFYVCNQFNYLRIIFISLLFFGPIRNSMLFIGITVDYSNCDLRQRLSRRRSLMKTFIRKLSESQSVLSQ